MEVSTHLSALFERDLKVLRKEIESYKNEPTLWVKAGEINNPPGNLALHICGNLKHFIGAILLKNGYERDRKFEFEGTAERQELLNQVDEALSVVTTFFSEVKSERYDEKYPLEVFGHEMTIFYFLVHLHGHLNYHLGQINYHRRILKSG